MNPKNYSSAKGRQLLSSTLVVAIVVLLLTALYLSTSSRHQTARLAASSLYQNAMLSAELGDLEGALAEITKAIDVQPEQPTFYAMRAAYRNQLEGAPISLVIADLDRAVSYARDESRVPFLEQRLAAYLEKGWFDNAVQDWERLIHLAEYPEQAAQYLLARAQMYRDSLQQPERALYDFEQALAKAEQPITKIDVLMEQAQLFFLHPQSSTYAQRNLMQALELIASQQLMADERQEQIERVWHGLTPLPPADALAICLAHFEHFKGLLQQQIPDEQLYFEAFSKYAQTYGLTSDDPRYFGQQAIFYEGIYPWNDRQKLYFLTKTYTKAIALSDGDLRRNYLQARGYCYDQLGNHSRAEADLRQAFPSAQDYLLARGFFYDKKEDFDAADAFYRKAYDRDVFYQNRAIFYDSLGKYDRSDAYWKKILPHSEFLKNRSRFYDEKELYDRADPFLRAQSDRLDFYAERGTMYHQLGRYQKARRFLDKAVGEARKRGDDRLSDLYRVRAQNYDALDQYEEADKNWKRVLTKTTFFQQRAVYYFCHGIVQADAKIKRQLLRRAERYFEQIDTTDDRAMLERVYFYKLTNQTEAVTDDLEYLRFRYQGNRHFSVDLLLLFESTETLELFHQNKIDPCAFSEKLRQPWGFGGKGR